MAVVFVMAVLVIVFDTSEGPLWFVLGALATAVPGLVGAWRTLVR
jgi:Na+/H+-translocating membrane pyrophosphatase